MAPKRTPPPGVCCRLQPGPPPADTLSLGAAFSGCFTHRKCMRWLAPAWWVRALFLPSLNGVPALSCEPRTSWACVSVALFPDIPSRLVS